MQPCSQVHIMQTIRPRFDMTPKTLSHVWLSAGKTEAKLYPGERGVRKVAEASQNWFYRTIYDKKRR